jgi:hypothetical protein
MKAVYYKGSTVSVIHPSTYRQRFLDFMTVTCFKAPESSGVPITATGGGSAAPVTEPVTRAIISLDTCHFTSPRANQSRHLPSNLVWLVAC